MGPLTDEMKRRAVEQQGDIRTTSPGRRSPSTSRSSRRRASRRTSPRTSGRRRSASTWSGSTIARRRPRSSRRCAALVRQEMAGGRARHRLVPHLRARHLRLDRRADRAQQGGGALRRPLHLAPAQRRRPVPGGGRRADHHRARGGRARRDLPPQGGGRVQLAQDGPGHREDRSRAQRRAPHHRGHVHLHRGLDRLRRLHPALVARRRLRRALQAHRRSGHPRAHDRGDADAGPGLGEPLPGRGHAAAGCCSSSSRTTRSSLSPARRSTRS